MLAVREDVRREAVTEMSSSSESSVRSIVVCSCACAIADVVGLLKSSPSPINRGGGLVEALLSRLNGVAGWEWFVLVRRLLDGGGVMLRLEDRVIWAWVRCQDVRLRVCQCVGRPKRTFREIGPALSASSESKSGMVQAWTERLVRQVGGNLRRVDVRSACAIESVELWYHWKGVVEVESKTPKMGQSMANAAASGKSRRRSQPILAYVRLAKRNDEGQAKVVALRNEFLRDSRATYNTSPRTKVNLR